MVLGVPDLTLFLGPQTQHGLAINSVVREYRAAMIGAGLAAHPTRIASPALRRVADPTDAPEARREAFRTLKGENAAFYSALNFLGDLPKSFRGPAIFPDAAIATLGEAAAGADLRIVLTPDALPDVFVSAGSDALDSQVRATPWEVLFELSWAELAAGLRQAVPQAEMLVLTHGGVALGGADLQARLFGAAAKSLPPYSFLRSTLNTTGQAVLGRIDAEKGPEPRMAAELYGSFADRAGPQVCRERLGLDRLTVKLLKQRYDEDIAAIASMDRVEVI